MRRRFLSVFPLRLRGGALTWKSQNHSHSHSHSHGSCHHHHHHHHEKLEAHMKGENLRRCQFVTVVGGGTNIFFCVVKIGVGSSGGSVALVADGFHALVDFIADVISYTALTLSVKPLPRCKFPFGIGRLETAGAVIVAAVLLFVGAGLLVQSLQECLAQAQRFFVQNSESHSSEDSQNETHHSDHSASHKCDGSHHSHHGLHGHSHFDVTEIDASGHVRILWAMVCVSVASIVCKEMLFRWTKRVGERAGSRVVVANAYHHRADAWSGAVALVGVAGHCVGVPGIDGLAGLCVSGSICQMGARLLRGSVLEFFDFQSAEEVANVRRALQKFESPRLVNVFLIRHGHSYALHVTLLVEAGATAETIAHAARDLTALAKHSVAVEDTFTTLFLCNKEQEASLAGALNMVVRFHGLMKIEYDWEGRSLRVSRGMHDECMQDIRRVAELYGMEIILTETEGNGRGHLKHLKE